MGYIKSRQNGEIMGNYCDVCGKELVKVVPNPLDKNQDICAECYHEFFDKKDNKDLIKCIEYLENKQDLLIKFIYEFFYNHSELLNEDDLGRLNAVINYRG